MDETTKARRRIKRLRKALDRTASCRMDLAMPLGPKVTAREVADRVSDLVEAVADAQAVILKSVIELEKARLRGGEAGPKAG